MEVIWTSPLEKATGLKRLWKRRRYTRLNGGGYGKTVRMGGGSPRRSWRGIRVIPRLRLRVIAASPLKLWRKMKNAYVNMMLSLAGNVGSTCEGNALSGKRIPKARKPNPGYSNAEFENRLIFEIYKNLVPSYELNSGR